MADAQSAAPTQPAASAVSAPLAPQSEISAVERARRHRWWLIHAVQLAVLIPVLLSQLEPWVLWPSAIFASIICCAGTDSGWRWRWRNRLLIAEAITWLATALILGTA